MIRAAYVGNKGTHISGSRRLQPGQEVNPAIYIPGRSTVSNTQERRPYQDFSSVSEIGSNNNTNYHSGQLTVERRFSRGLSVLANYTWSKLLDDSRWTNPFNRRSITGGRAMMWRTTSSCPAFGRSRVSRCTAPAGVLLNGWGTTRT